MKRLIALFLIMFAPQTHAQQSPSDMILAAAVEIETATGLLIEAQNATNRAQSLARAIRSLEDGLTALRVALRSSAAQENVVRQGFQDKTNELGGLLAALQSINQASSPTAMVHPDGAVGAARAGMIIAAIAPELENQTMALRRDIALLQAFNDSHSAAEKNLRAALSDLQNARVELNAAQQAERQVPLDLMDDAGQLDRLLLAAEDLNFLATEIEKLPLDAIETESEFADKKGTLITPISGLLLQRFGRRDAGGQIQPGITIQAPALSLVTAQNKATVRFAGQFLEYGNMVILEPAAGYLQVLAGFGHIYVIEGEVVDTGDALGLLQGQIPTADEFLIEMSSATTGNSFETLYIELRHDGQPVDPLPWFIGITE